MLLATLKYDNKASFSLLSEHPRNETNPSRSGNIVQNFHFRLMRNFRRIRKLFRRYLRTKRSTRQEIITGQESPAITMTNDNFLNANDSSDKIISNSDLTEPVTANHHTSRNDNTISAAPVMSQQTSRSRFDLHGNRGESTSRDPRSAAGSLSENLRNARVKCAENWTYFIPLDKQQALITVTVIEDEIRKGDPENPSIRCRDPKAYARWTDQNARRLFTTLAYVKKGAWICPLREHGLSDEDLPLDLEEREERAYALRRRKDGAVLQVFETWDSDSLEEFVRVQWWMLAPKFDKHTLKCRNLPAEIVLPLCPIKEEEIFEHAVPHGRVAGFSTVTAFRIHSAHHNFWRLDSIPEERHPRIAIKTLLETARDSESEFEKEKSILDKLGPRNHPHLINLYTTYCLKDHYSFVFPCAESNLRNFWERSKCPNFDKRTVLWSLKQMAGLASGLSLIHNFKTTVALAPEGGFMLPDEGIKLAVQTGEEMFGRHGDIKPENILWFKRPLDTEQQDGMGVLKITDFGLGRFHGRESRSNVDPKSIYNSPTYEPPECKLEVPVTRKYDMWSLGCLYLEFITWLLEGEDKIEEFSNNRGARRDPSILVNGKEFEVIRDPVINDDNFFTIFRDDDSFKGKSAIVRHAVVEWVDHLRTTKRCSHLIHDLLDLIMKDLLNPYSSQRTDAEKLNVLMKDLVRKAEKREDYLLKPVPRVFPTSSFSKPVNQNLLSNKHVKFSPTWPSSSRER